MSEIPAEATALAVRFWSHVAIVDGDGCWFWMGADDEDGYGRVKVDGRLERAHRVAWVLTRGPIPRGLDVLHRCDRRRCCRPACLFLGTDATNAIDKVAKGRSLRGVQQASAKLDDECVRELRALRRVGWSLRRLAGRYGVCVTTVDRTVRRTRWKHVGDNVAHVGTGDALLIDPPMPEPMPEPLALAA